jgi:hypothetical protein
MRAYFVSSGLQGCYAVRCLFPMCANGWDGDQTSLDMDQREPDNKARATAQCDVVVFHRPDDPKKLTLARLLKKELGKKIVYDNDDTYKDDGGFKFNKFMDEARGKANMATMNETLDAFIKEADLVTCSTEFLAEEYRKLNPNVVVLKNCVDPFYYDEPLRNDSGAYRIGITGSIGITSDMELVKPIVEHFRGRKDVRFVLFSLPPAKGDTMTRQLYHDEYAFWETVDVEWQPFVPMAQYYDQLNSLRLDLMVIPRADNYFNRCKSNLKFLEASMFEIPVIAQGFPDGKSPYEVNPDDAKHMVIVKDNSKWIGEIEKAIEDREDTAEMGRRAREYVLENYDIDRNGHLWEENYLKMFKQND